jgi:hypothetical protein
MMNKRKTYVSMANMEFALQLDQSLFRVWKCLH